MSMTPRELHHEIGKLLVSRLRKLDSQLDPLALNAYAREVVWWHKQYQLMGFRLEWDPMRQRFRCIEADEVGSLRRSCDELSRIGGRRQP